MPGHAQSMWLSRRVLILEDGGRNVLWRPEARRGGGPYRGRGREVGSGDNPSLIRLPEHQESAAAASTESHD